MTASEQTTAAEPHAVQKMTLATLTALWLPPLLGGFIIIGLVSMLVRLNPRFRLYDAEQPVP